MARLTALLDTSFLLSTDPLQVPSGWCTSAVVVGEIRAGVLLAPDVSVRTLRLDRLTTVLSAAPVLPVDPSVADRYAHLRTRTGRRPSNDLWIAATALAHDLELVTRDERLASLPLVRSRLVGS